MYIIVFQMMNFVRIPKRAFLQERTMLVTLKMIKKNRAHKKKYKKENGIPLLEKILNVMYNQKKREENYFKTTINFEIILFCQT